MKKYRTNLQNLLQTTALIVPLILSIPLQTAPTQANILERLAHQPQNNLANESSPYLKLHSRDLVKWNSWNKATLKKALDSGKPIFLSIGYSACHWCHVMQEESFNNPAIAKLLNENYTPILVDREQRPDLDETYMVATEAITGQGGWPNNVFLTPDLKPFYAGIYFPPENLIKKLTLINQDWQKKPSSIQLEADRIATVLTGFFTRKTAAKNLTKDVLVKAGEKLLARFDEFNGGMGTSPKHFNAPALAFVTHLAQHENNIHAREAMTITLNAIAAGGVRDHLAGGFHRYAVDNNWRTPHFEKMLYDQAQMSELYLQMYTLTGDQKFAEVAKSTLDYVLDDLTSPQGGFYSTRDADSLDKKGGKSDEGTYYVWTSEQFILSLGKDDASFLLKQLGTQTQGDFADKVIIHRNIDISGNDLIRFNSLLEKLKLVRDRRIEPHRDEKILTGWNGLMISAFAKAAITLNDKTYKNTAIKAGEFIWQNLRDNKGNLFRSYYEGKAGISGTLVDYAYLSNAYIDLYDLTENELWIKRAKKLITQMDKLFKDKEHGDYYYTAAKQGFARIKLRGDSALPSGNAAALKAIVKLSRRSFGPEYARRAEALIAALSGDAVADVQGGATTFIAADTFLRGTNAPNQYASRGRIKLSASLSPDLKKFIVKVKLAPDWHLNAHKPFEDQFIPTSLSLKTEAEVLDNVQTAYPKAISRKLGFNSKPLALYENTFTITSTLASPASKPITGELTIQTCNNELCLLPETVKLSVTPILKK